jgi:aminoglycoside phosphotransferase (APT) family kinase protein
MHADELELDAALVRRLLAEQFPDWAELPLERVRYEGTDNAIFRLGDEMAVRLPRRESGAEAPARESETLRRLEPHLPLPIPQPLALGRPGAGYPFPWAVHSWLPGTTAAGEIAGAGPALAEFLRALQSIETSGAPQASRGRPLTSSDAFVERLRSCRDLFDTDAALSLWEAAVAAPAWDRPPVWLHSDLDPRNLCLQGGAVVGVLDFGSAGIGDPAFDYAVAFKVLPAEERDAFRATVDVDDATWLRGRGWVVQQCAMALSYYTLENNPPLFTGASRWIAEVL